MKRPEKENLDINYEKILHAVLNKSRMQWPHNTSVVRSITSYLVKYPSKTSKTHRTLICDVLWNTTHGHTSFGWLAKTYIHQLCIDTW